MKTRLDVLLLSLTCLCALPSRADGLIIVHEPIHFPRHGPRFHSFAPLKVRYHHVNARIRDQVAVTEVDQEFYNPNDQRLEGTYLFPVPKSAQINKFSMDVDGKEMTAELLSADKAREIYEDIVRRHRDPALLEYAGRDLFKVRIFPIEPRSTKRVRLSYTELLTADSGIVGYLYPLNTEKFSAKPLENVSLKIDIESRYPLKSIYSPSHLVEVRRDGDKRAVIGFEAKNVKPDTDFQLYFAPEPGELGMNLLTYRTSAEEGFFMLLASPKFEDKSVKSIPKDVTFVLDTSGLMAGQKLEQAKQALRFCVNNLNDNDRFEIIRFSTETEPLFNGLQQATQTNRKRAEEFVRDLRAIGGTAIDQAIRKALQPRPDKTDRPAIVIFITDGIPTVGETDPDRILAAVKQATVGSVRVFCFGLGHDVNTHLLDQITEETRAYSQYVLPEEDLELKLSNFFSKIKEPLLGQLSLGFPGSVRASLLYPTPLPDLFKGDQLVLIGRYSGNGKGKISLDGTVNGVKHTFSCEADFPTEARDHEFLPRLWATRRVGFLMDQIRLHGENTELRDEVTDLARRYGLVTPYTAFLIHEDEMRRDVPLGMQSLPGLQRNQDLLHASEQAYQDLRLQTSGQSAIAAARYGRAYKSADQVSQALTLGLQEANRPYPSAPSPMAVPPPQVSGPGAAQVAPQNLPVQVESPSAADATQFVGGRTFYQSGTQWTDSLVQKTPKAQRVRVQFNSPEYFNLLAANDQVRPWAALGQNVQFVLGETVYEIYE